MPKKRGPKKPSVGGRLVGLIAGIALLISGGLGTYRALQDKTGTQSPIMGLAIILPAVVLLRYAATGKIKLN